MAGIFDDLVPQQSGQTDDIFADLVPKNYSPPPLPPARPSQEELLSALGIGGGDTPPPPMPAPALSGIIGDTTAKLDAQLGQQADTPVGPPIPTDTPLPPRRPDAPPLPEAPLPPINTAFNPADTRGLTLDLPADQRMRDTRGKIGGILGHTNMTIEESVASVNAGIAAAEKEVEASAERARIARDRFAKIQAATGDRPLRPGSQTALQFNTIKQQLEKEELAYSEAVKNLGSARQAQGPALYPEVDAARRGLETVGNFLPDAAAGALRPVDGLLGTDLAKGPKAVTDYITKNIAEDPARNDELIAGLGQGAGSAVAFIGGGAGLKALGLSHKASSIILGGFNNAEQRYADAEKLGQKGMDLAKQWAAGFAIGGTEGVMGLGKMLDDLERATGGGFKRWAGLVLKEKGEEAFQEGVQTILGNLADRQLSGQNKPIEEGLGHAMLIGGLVGAGMTAVSAAPQLASDLMLKRELMNLKPTEGYDDIHAGILRELGMSGPNAQTRPLNPEDPNVSTPPPPAGAGAGGPGAAPQPPVPADVPAPAGDPAAAGNPAGFGPGPEGAGAGNVGDPADAGSNQPAVGPLSGELGTETLEADPVQQPGAKPPASVDTAPKTQPVSQDEQDLRLLMGDGWDLETAQDIMKSRGERAQAIREAQERGVQPVEGPIQGYEPPETQPVSGPVSHETATPSASDAKGGAPNAKDAPSVASSQAQPPSSEPLATSPSLTGTPEGSGETPPRNNSSTKPFPKDLAELRAGLPRDAAGDPDYSALEKASEAVTGKVQPWGRLSQEEKQAVWDRLNGQGNGSGTAKPAPVDNGESQGAKGSTLPSSEGLKGSTLPETQPVSGRKTLKDLPTNILGAVTSTLMDSPAHPETGDQRPTLTDEERQALRDHGVEISDANNISGAEVERLMQERSSRNGTGGPKEGFKVEESEESKDRNARRKTVNELASRWDALGEPEKAKALRDQRHNPPPVHDLLEHKLQVEAAERRKEHSDRRGQEGANTTPGTRISWSTLGEWTDGAHELNRRAHSTPRFAQEKAHLEELAKRPDLIRNASADELRRLIDALDGRIHTLSKPKPSAAGTTWEKVNQLARDRLAQIEQGRGDKVKTPRQDKREPKNLLELIAKNGGLAPSTELTMRDLHNHFIPGFGRLVRKGGMDIDKARELANEHGYLQDGSWNDVLNLIEGLANKKADPRTLSEQNYDDESEQDDGQREHEISNAIQEALDEMGLGSQIDDEALSLAVDLVMKGESDLVNAYERAIMQLEARDPETASEFEEADIPFEAYDEETIGETEPESRDDLEEQGDEDAEGRIEESADDAQEGQRPAADRSDEGSDGRPDDGARPVGNSRPRSGEVSEGSVLDEDLLAALEDVRRDKGKNTAGSIRKRLLDEGYAKGGSKLQLTDKGKKALNDEYDRQREAERDPVAEDLIERGLMSGYQDTINLGGMPWLNGKQLHSFEPSYAPSRKFSFALHYDRQPGGGSVYVEDERLLKDPAVVAWSDEAGIDVEYRPHPYPYNDHASWHHAVDLAYDKHWQTLVESQEFTTKEDIAGAIAFHVAIKGQLSTENARNLADATGLEDPGYEQGVQDLFDHMDVKPSKNEKGKPNGHFVNFHIGKYGADRSLEERQREAFAIIHAYENGFLTYDRAGHKQPTQKLLDLLSGELDLAEAKKGGKPAKAEKPSKKGEKTDTKPAVEGPKHIGVNHEGLPLWEDGNGVRSIMENGVRISESVVVRPTGQIEVKTHKEARFQTEAEYMAEVAEDERNLGVSAWKEKYGNRNPKEEFGIPSLAFIKKKLGPVGTFEINGITFRVGTRTGLRGRLSIVAERIVKNGNKRPEITKINSTDQGEYEGQSTFLDRAASWVRSELIRDRKDSLPPGSTSHFIKPDPKPAPAAPKTHAEVNEEYLARKGRYVTDMDGASEEDQWTLTQDFIKARIPELFVLFPGRLTFDRIAGNLGDPIRGGLFGEAEVQEALDDLIEDGIVEQDGKSYILASVKAQEGSAWDGVETMSPDKIFPTPGKKVFSADAVTETLTQAQAKARIQEWKDRAKQIGDTEDNSHKVVFSLFDRTGVWSQPWEDAGYTVIRYDITNGDDLLANFPIHDLLNARTKSSVNGKPFEVVGVLAAPPCTSFASSGARWWETQHDVPGMVAKKYGLWAAEYFDTPLEYATTLVAATEAIIEMANPSQFHVLENPIGRIQSEAGLPDPVLQWEPHHYGDPYTKKTHLWGVFNPNLPTANVEPVEGSLIAKLRGDLEEDKLARSETPEGFAYAFFMGNHPGAMVTAEKGADGKPQTVIPGAEQDVKGAAQIRAEGGLKPKVPQKDTDGLSLFNDSSKQGDLLDNLGPAPIASSETIPARLKRLREQMTVFASGMSRIGDLTAATWTFGDFKSRGVGVVADQLSKNGIDHLARGIISRRVQAFVDSGAFNHFQATIKGKNPPAMDWNAVLGKYEALQERLSYYNDPTSRPERPVDDDGEEIFTDLEDWADEEDYFRMGFGREEDFPKPLVVMPDVVGDQTASLELLEQFSVHIQDELQFGVTKPIIPIQKGDLTMAEAYAQAVEILGTDDFIVGIPSNKKALTDEELKAFLEEARPRKIHFLGAAAPKNLDPKLQILAQVGLELDHLSADGNMARGSDFGDPQIKDQHGRPMAVGEALQTKSPESYEGRELHEVLGEKVRQGLLPNILQARKIAKAMGEEDPKKVEEAIEFGLVLQARTIAQRYENAPDVAFEQLVELYENQPNLKTRTSESMLNQAYSTPIPLAYIASRLAGVTKSDFVLEPSAGNGALLIEANPQYVFANEINPARRANLEKQGFHVTGQDAADGVPQIDEMDVVIANPPFGVVKDEIGDSNEYDLTDIQKGYRTKEIDHAISLRALAEMKADGRAVLIIGSVNPQQDRARGYRGKAKNEFFLTLLKNYNVVEHFTVDGKLYGRQGASWPVDVIVIQGKGTSSLDHPAKTPPPVLTSWEEVGGKLNGLERPEGAATQSGDGLAGGGTGRGGSDAGVSGNALSSGEGELQPTLDGQSEDVSQSPDRGQRGSGGRTRGSGGRGGSRGSSRSGGTSGDVSTKDALAAAMDEFYGGEETAPAPAAADPKAEEATRFRNALIKLSEAYAPGADGRDVRYVVKRQGDRYHTTQYLPGVEHGSRAYTTAQEAIEEAVRRAYGAEYARTIPPIIGTFRLNLADAADFALGRNGYEKNEKSANRFLESALRDLTDIAKDPVLTDHIQEDAPLIRKVSKALNREIEIPKNKKPKIAKPAKAAAANVAAGIKEAAEGLWDVFGGNTSKLSSGFTFDEETYAKAKPHFLKAIAHLKDAAANVVQVARELVGYFKNVMGASKAMVDKMLPYLERFIDEVRGGTATQTTKTFDDQDLEDAPEQQRPAAQQPTDLDETANQVTYRPRSGIFGLGTLVPTNMRSATEMALEALEQKVGNLEQYVGKKLGYKTDAQGPYFIRNGQKERPFAAEQIDALSLAIDNMERGAALIIGDQTGIGKGRVNAGILRYAMERKAVPIFVTKDRGLYKDIYRDMTDIGMQEYLGREPNLLMTDSKENVPLDEEETIVLKTPDLAKHSKTLREIAQQGHLGEYDVLLTSYGQMQTVKGQETERMRTIEALAPNSILALDESHNAGGTDIDAEAKFDAKVRAWEKKRDKAIRQGKPFNIPEPQMVPDRAQFARIIIGKAKAAFYSSATYAKRPEVMDLYAKTDMRLAVDDISELAGAISEGGVPMQQVVAAMLARAGQYVRRERSFAGVTYEPSEVAVDEELYDNFSTSLRMIQDFSNAVAAATAEIDEGLRNSGQMVGHDNATGRAGADSMNFTSIMHNLINQMLLSINAIPSARAAIEAVRNGEKPLIALANTNESFLTDYAKDQGLKVGDPIDLDMSAMLARYLERTRWISVREPFMEEGEEAEKRRLTDEELGPEGVELFEAVKEFLAETDFSGLPASPVDAIKGEFKKAGIRVGEITGRTLTIDYSGDRPVLRNRPGEERTTRGKNKTISGFNGGELDALIINQSGSTGFSMHASGKFKDRRPRVMILAQAESNIDIHMQMLGRIHRTGQVELPRYLQLIPAIPAAKRPAAILLKKMASLNANTTANRSSALTADGVVDFLNEYGDAVAANILRDDHELNERLGYVLQPEATNYDDAMRKMTGRIPLLPIQEQRDLYDRIENTYNEYLAQLEAEGRNTLEAKTLDLDAVPLRSVVAEEGKGDSPFTEAVHMTEYDVKRQGRPYQVSELIEDVAAGVGRTLSADPAQALREAEEAGHNIRLDMLQKALLGFGPFKEKFLGRIHDEAKRENQRKRLDEQEATFRDTINLVYPGSRVRLKFADDDSVTGIVTKVTPPKDTAPNPIAPGQWKAQVAVPTGARSYSLQFTRLVIGKDPENDEIGIEDAGWSEPYEATAKIFEMAANAPQRETRVIATGNLLKAYTTVAAGGSIINFQTRDGQTVPGILLREKVKDLSAAMSGKRVALTLDQALEAVSRSGAPPIISDDGFLIVAQPRDGTFRILANKARNKGGRYFLNQGIIDAAGKQFYSTTANMVVDVTQPKIRAVLSAAMDVGAKFTIGASLDESAIIAHPDAAPTQGMVRAEGLYSTALKAAENAKIKKGTGQQWLSTLLNTPGVKAEEIAWIGLDTWLVNQKSVTKEDVVAFVRDNQIEIREITKGANPITDAEIQAKAKEIYEEELSLQVDDYLERYGDNTESWFAEAVEEEDEDSTGWEGTGFEDEMGDDLFELAGEERPTKWTYVLHGSDGEPETSWKTYDSEDAALKAGEIEADRRNASQSDDIRTEIANNRMRPWDQFEKEAREALEEERGDTAVSYGSYQVPGGTRYREVLLTLPLRFTEKPDASGQIPFNRYSSSHWDEPNILAHVRLNEREIDGERTLFIEEIQSDWHQAGRKRGYKGDPADDAAEAAWREADADFLRAATAYNEALEEYQKHDPHTPEARFLRPSLQTAEAWYTAASERMNAADEARGGGDKVTNAPFKTSWHELALKRIVRMAVDEGYDQIAWTSGHIQNTRYDLSKHFYSVAVQYTSGGIGIPQDLPFTQGSFIAHDINGKEVHRQSIWDVAQLEELIGKELADKLLAQPSRTGNYSGLGVRIWELEGADLTVGGTGMTGFYDKILPAAADKLGKRFGARTWKDGGRVLVDYYEASDLFMAASDFEDDSGRTIWTDAHAARSHEYKAAIPVHTFPISAGLKLAATVDGFPMFQLRLSPEGRTAMEQARQDLLREIAANVVGSHGSVEFVTSMSGSAADMARSTGQRTGQAELIGQYADRVLRIGLTGDSETIYHESFHLFQHLGGFTPQEVALLERERSRNRAFVAKHHGLIDDPSEIDAYAAGLYGKFADQNAPGKMVGLHVGLRRAFEKLRRFVRRVLNKLNGYGFQISEDIFERSRSGELRRRLDAGKGIGKGGAGYGPVWDWEIRRMAVNTTNRQMIEMEARPQQGMATFDKTSIDEVKALNAAHGSPTPTPRAPTTSFPNPTQTKLDRVRESQQDAFTRLNKLQEAITAHRGAPIPEPADAYLAQTLYSSRKSARLKAFKQTYVDPLIEEVKNAKVSTHEIGLYLIAKHARERNAEMATRDPASFGMDNGSGMADATADHYLTKYAAEGKEPALERIAQLVYAIIEHDKDNRHNAGLISDETRDHWDNLFPSGRYVPLRGMAERDEDYDGSHYGRGFDIRGREAIPATGRFTLSDNPLYTVIHMAEEGIVRAEKNTAGKSLLRLVKSNPHDEVWKIVRNPTVKDLHPTTGQVRDISDPRYLNKDNVIGVKVGGTPHFIELSDVNLGLAYRNMGVPQFNKFIQNYAAIGRMYAQLQTGRNPAFFLPNFLRDVQDAAVTVSTLDKGLTAPFLANVPLALKAALAHSIGRSAGATWDPILAEWEAEGGKIDMYGMRDLDAIAREIEAEIRRSAWSPMKRAPLALVKGTLRFIDATNEIFESATRLAVYKVAREKGLTKKRAAALALEATTNFNRRGRHSVAMNIAWMFYNAAVQGSAKNVSLLIRSRKMQVAWGGMIALGFMMGMLSRAFDDDDEDERSPWDNVPEYDKRGNIILPFGTKKDAEGNTTLKYGKIPLMFGFKIPYYLGVTAADVMLGGKNAKKAAMDVLTNTVDAFNPLGQGQLMTIIFPTLTKPVAELLLNSNYQERNIYPDKERWNEGLPRSSQPTNAATPDWAIGTTELINRATGGDKYNPGLIDIYPGVVDYTVSWVGGGLGRTISNGVQSIWTGAQGGETPPERWPVVNRFYGATNGSGEASVYYENRKDAEEHKNRFQQAKRALNEDPDDQAALDTYLREGEWLGVKTGNPSKKVDWKQSTTRLIDDADEVIKGMRQEKQRILSDKALPLADRQRQAKDLDSQIWAMQRATRRDLKAMTTPAEPASRIQREEVGGRIQQEGIWEKLFGSSGPKTIPAETDRPFPTNEDLEQARKAGVFYGRDEAFLNGDRARIYGSVEKTAVPPPKGAKKGAKPTVLETFRAEATPDGKLDPIMESLSDPRKTSIQPVTDPQLRDDLGKAALAANRTALSTLGYRPRRTTLDTKSGPSNLGGAYSPENDEGLILTQGNPSTPTHEAIHRGIDRVRKARPDLFEGWKVDEESMVREVMRTVMGNPEQGKGSIADKLLGRAKFHFEDTLDARSNKKRLGDIEAAAAELIRQDRPRGGPR